MSTMIGGPSEKDIDDAAHLGQSPSSEGRHSEDGYSTPSTNEKKEARVDNSGAQNIETDPLAHLPEHEQQILRRQLDTTQIKVGVRTLYRYATRIDLLIMAVCAVSAIVA